jgi:ABC-2 type transport system permease protein
VVFDLRLPSSPIVWIGFTLTVIGAAIVASRWWFLVSLSSFWFIGDVRGLLQLASGLLLFCSGTIVPLQFLPDGLADVVRRTPFATMGQLPAEVFLGRSRLVTVLAAQALWPWRCTCSACWCCAERRASW